MAAPEISHDDLLACAVEAATEATQHAVKNRHRRREVAASFAHDVKLNLDAECQQKAEAAIRAAYPTHAILGEEGDDGTGGDSPFRWIIDPIDGTVNFSHGLAIWCSSVCVRHGDTALAATVYAPELGELYTATADGPALCNGEPIEVSDTPDLEQAMILTGVNKLLLPDPRAFAMFERLSRRAQKARILGAAGLDICRVACGQVDGYLEAGVSTWDVEAGGLIVRRAGGEAMCLYREPASHRCCYIASNPDIHAELLALFDPADLPR